MTIKEEDDEDYTPVASVVQKNDQSFVDWNDPEVIKKAMNNKKRLNMIPPK